MAVAHQRKLYNNVDGIETNIQTAPATHALRKLHKAAHTTKNCEQAIATTDGRKNVFNMETKEFMSPQIHVPEHCPNADPLSRPTKLQVTYNKSQPHR